MAQPAVKGKRILVINDTPAILDLFTELLEDEGYQVATDTFVGELRDMLARVQTDCPDLIILDFIIRDEDRGWQFLQLLRMEPATATIPVVVCTAAAHTVEELGAHLQVMGVEVVLKPFDLEQLLAAVARALAPPEPASPAGDRRPPPPVTHER